MKRGYFWIIALLILAAIAGIWYTFTAAERQNSPRGKEQAQAETGVTIGKTAPAFTLDSLDGKTVQVGGLGEPYVLNFWASWCPPCREEMPEMVEFAGKYGSQVQFYGVNLQEPKEKVNAFLQQNHYVFPVLLDKNGTVAQTFRVSAIPTTIVVDSKGIIRYRKTGGVTLSELEGIIKGL
ncbi:MAG: TlpA disulfide reductase family protein [Veillonellales bacterium]